MTPAQYLVGCVILIGALGASLVTLAATLWPARAKIGAVLAARGRQ